MTRSSIPPPEGQIPSWRGGRFPRADFAPLALYDPGRVPVDVDLSDNTNLWGPHPAGMEAVLTSPLRQVTRYPSVYAQPLKEAVARRFGVSTENVTTGCGSDGLLDAAFRAAVQPPGRMAHPDPTFSVVSVFARMNALEAVPVPWHEVEDDPAALLACDPDLVYVCRPNNPTGHLTPERWFDELLDIIGPGGPVVVVDEAYADYAGETLVSRALASERLLVLRTLSKLYGLAGLRVGFGIGSPLLVREVEKARGPYQVGGLAEAAAVAALDHPPGWVETVVGSTVQNRERLARELTDRGLAPLPSRANFLLVPLQGRGAIETNEALKVRGVSTRPFRGLPEIGDALRVTVGPWQQMERFLQALDDALEGEEDLR